VARDRQAREDGEALISESERKELHRLGWTNAQLAMECDVLKRSTALWVKKSDGAVRLAGFIAAQGGLSITRKGFAAVQASPMLRIVAANAAPAVISRTVQFAVREVRAHIGDQRATPQGDPRRGRMTRPPRPWGRAGRTVPMCWTPCRFASGSRCRTLSEGLTGWWSLGDSNP